MSWKNRLAKLIIDPAFRHPGMLKMIFALDDATGIDLVKTLAPIKLMPASAELFTRCFAHFVSGEEISLNAATELAALAPDRASKHYLLLQAEEERVHLEHFRAKLSQFGLGQAKLAKFVAPNFNMFDVVIRKRIAARDFTGGIIGNNVVVEGLAICLLELGCRDLRANSDEIGKFLDFVLRDERHHVRFGERKLLWCHERGLIDDRRATESFEEMWHYVELATADIPDVLEAMGLQRADLLAEVRAFYRERFVQAGLDVAA